MGLIRAAAQCLVALTLVATIALDTLAQSQGPAASTSAAPTSSPPPSLIPQGTICTSTTCLTGDLQAGTYSIEQGTYSPARLTLLVPAGWTTWEGFVAKGHDLPPFDVPGWDGDVMLVTWMVSHIYGDACSWRGSLVDVGTTVGELATALQGQGGRTASAPTDVVLGGFPATRIDLTIPTDIDEYTCDGGYLRFWPDPGPDEDGGMCCARVGSTDVLYIVDVDGQRLVVVARDSPSASEQDLAELEQVIASIRIDHPDVGPSPTT